MIDAREASINLPKGLGALAVSVRTLRTGPIRPCSSLAVFVWAIDTCVQKSRITKIASLVRMTASNRFRAKRILSRNCAEKFLQINLPRVLCNHPVAVEGVLIEKLIHRHCPTGNGGLGF